MWNVGGPIEPKARPGNRAAQRELRALVEAMAATLLGQRNGEISEPFPMTLARLVELARGTAGAVGGQALAPKALYLRDDFKQRMVVAFRDEDSPVALVQDRRKLAHSPAVLLGVLMRARNRGVGRRLYTEADLKEEVSQPLKADLVAGLRGAATLPPGFSWIEGRGRRGTERRFFFDQDRHVGSALLTPAEAPLAGTPLAGAPLACAAVPEAAAPAVFHNYLLLDAEGRAVNHFYCEGPIPDFMKTSAVAEIIKDYQGPYYPGGKWTGKMLLDPNPPSNPAPKVAPGLVAL